MIRIIPYASFNEPPPVLPQYKQNSWAAPAISFNRDNMVPIELTFFSVTLFLALVALLEWKRRRMKIQERVNKGLKGYVASTPTTPEHPETDSPKDVFVTPSVSALQTAESKS
jgi:hypothetical protein